MPSMPLQPSAGSAGAAPVITSLRGETPADYIRRILSYSEGKDARAVLEATPRRLRTIVQETPATVLRRQPAPGKWSPAQILELLPMPDRRLALRAILGETERLQAFDQEIGSNRPTKSRPGESSRLRGVRGRIRRWTE